MSARDDTKWVWAEILNAMISCRKRGHRYITGYCQRCGKREPCSLQ